MELTKFLSLRSLVKRAPGECQLKLAHLAGKFVEAVWLLGETELIFSCITYLFMHGHRFAEVFESRVIFLQSESESSISEKEKEKT